MRAATHGSPRAVVADDRPPSSDPAVDSRWLSDLAGRALVALGITGAAELAVTLVTVERITELNRAHLGGAGPTDVLSFPMDGRQPPAGGDGGEGGGPPWTLGDVVICPQVAAEQAPGHAGTLEDELALLCVHGILHVLGHDHAEVDEALIMRAEEARVLEVVHRRVGAGTEVPG